MMKRKWSHALYVPNIRTWCLAQSSIPAQLTSRVDLLWPNVLAGRWWFGRDSRPYTLSTRRTPLSVDPMRFARVTNSIGWHSRWVVRLVCLLEWWHWCTNTVDRRDRCHSIERTRSHCTWCMGLNFQSDAVCLQSTPNDSTRDRCLPMKWMANIRMSGLHCHLPAYTRKSRNWSVTLCACTGTDSSLDSDDLLCLQQ